VTNEVKATTGASVMVAVSTCGLPFVPGYGTILSQLVVLGAWAVVAAATSGVFADHYHEVVWPVALLLNLTAFGTPLLLLRYGLSRVSAGARIAAVLIWTSFYLASLFVLFPATDGP